ncbi:dehydrogenase with different specificitie [Lophiotrema nucula]|uniref:Dehydrogenase with different specificitie n=1 Tax=Lophiotrema nucula TaxID=690887 RepID=A0A6A5YTU0_9PLEO|nr:dehydrogenase with different specificitie [Lophiotrema nucula]
MASPNPAPVVLITGANQGIGYHIAALLSESKISYTLLVGARNATRGEEAVAKLNKTKPNEGTVIAPLVVDIDSHDSILGAVAEVEKIYTRLDILINNAAIMTFTGERSDWAKVFTTNVIGTVDITQCFAPLLNSSATPKVVVVSSSMGSITMAESSPKHPLAKDASPYRASKAAINMVMVEWVKYLPSIKFWGVDPGLCATDFGGEYSRSKGRDPKEGAEIVRQCIEGERDEYIGKVVFDQFGETGARPW